MAGSNADNSNERLREWDSDKVEGVQKSQIYADVICARPLSRLSLPPSLFTVTLTLEPLRDNGAKLVIPGHLIYVEESSSFPSFDGFMLGSRLGFSVTRNFFKPSMAAGLTAKVGTLLNERAGCE